MLEFSTPTSSAQREAKAWLEESQALIEFENFVQQETALETPLTLHFGAEQGPLYDPDLDAILFPYQFIIESRALLSTVPSAPNQIEHLEGAVLHTFLHELAHVLINHYAIPVLGREEDASDAFAAFFLLNEIDNGPTYTKAAASLFAMEAEKLGGPELIDLAGSQSLEKQRQYRTLCYIYGSDPNRHVALLDPELFDAEDKQTCQADYELAAAAWQEFL